MSSGSGSCPIMLQQLFKHKTVINLKKTYFFFSSSVRYCIVCSEIAKIYLSSIYSGKIGRVPHQWDKSWSGNQIMI
jgi:hypothetical protein